MRAKYRERASKRELKYVAANGGHINNVREGVIEGF